MHLVVGESAAGCLRAACTSFAMPGKVVGFFQDLTHGPLGDDAQRVAHFQSLGSWDGSTGESSGLWEQWRFLAMQLDQNAATTVTLWLGNNLCDEIFKAMACSQLVARPGNVSLVQVPAIGMRSFVAMHPPGQLAQLFETRKNRPLGLGTRAAHPSSRLLGAVCPT